MYDIAVSTLISVSPSDDAWWQFSASNNPTQFRLRRQSLSRRCMYILKHVEEAHSALKNTEAPNSTPRSYLQGISCLQFTRRLHRKQESYRMLESEYQCAICISENTPYRALSLNLLFLSQEGGFQFDLSQFPQERIRNFCITAHIGSLFIQFPLSPSLSKSSLMLCRITRRSRQDHTVNPITRRNTHH
jgi:hypothetical protein